MHEINFEDAVEKILAQDRRYARDAFFFVRDALELTKRRVHKENRERREEKHVTGQQLLEGIRELALKEFGPMTMTVFEEWGVRNCKDFGEIVFSMVEIGSFAKTEKDSREDFQKGYDFAEAFQKPFLPESRRAVATDRFSL
jgi:uncharacterized repeat protein (TIGR04138 family)